MDAILDVIQQNFVELTETLDIQEFLSVNKSLMSKYDYEHMLSMNRMDRNYDFLLNIQRFGKEVGHRFMSWLHEKGLTLTTCTQTQSERASEDQNRIRRKLVLLSKHINANAVVPHLFQDGYLKRDEVERIHLLPTRNERAHQLLTLLTSRYRSIGLLDSFTRALGMYQPHLCADFLQG